MAKIVFRMVSISITVLLGILIVCGLYRLGLKCYDFGYRVYTEPAVSEGNGRDMLVQVNEDMGAKELAGLMKEKGLVRDDRLFFLQEKLCGFKPEPGVYTVSTAMTARELMEAMTLPDKPVGDEAEP